MAKSSCLDWISRSSFKGHYKKHGEEVANALQRARPPFGEPDYKDGSFDAVAKARFRMEAEKWQGEELKHPLRRYHVTNLLLQTVTDMGKEKIFTYFPLSLGWQISPEKLPTLTRADRAELYRDYISEEEKAKKLRKVKKCHGFK